MAARFSSSSLAAESGGPVQKAIHEKLTGALSPSFLEVRNESFMHNVPEGSETHFKVTVVSGAFEGMKLLQRHRKVNELLSEELDGRSRYFGFIPRLVLFRKPSHTLPRKAPFTHYL